MIVTRRTWAGAALGTALLSAGCSGSGGTPQVASVNGDPVATATISNEAAQWVESVRRYADCLREGGVEVTDPDGRGQFEIVAADSATVEELRAVQLGCQHLWVAPPPELSNLPPLSPEQIAKNLEYAECMQNNGAPGFPDPQPDGYFWRPGDGPLTWDSTSEAAIRATRICGPIVGAIDPDAPGQG